MTKKISTIILLLVLFLIFPVSAEEAAQIELSADKSEVAIGESFRLAVILKNASTGNLNGGEIIIQGIDKFKRIGSSRSTQFKVINGVTTGVAETVLTLAAISEGEFKIGPAAIGIQGNSSAESNVITVKVVKEQKKSFFSDDDNRTIARSSKSGSKINIGRWFLNFLAAALLCAMAYMLYKRGSGREIFKHKEDGVQEDIQGYKVKIPDKDDPRFFEKIKGSLLEYIQNKYNIDTEILTSREVIEELRHDRIRDVEKIEQALKLCDQGSFASDGSGREKLIGLVGMFK